MNDFTDKVLGATVITLIILISSLAMVYDGIVSCLVRLDSTPTTIAR